MNEKNTYFRLGCGPNIATVWSSRIKKIASDSSAMYVTNATKATNNVFLIGNLKICLMKFMLAYDILNFDKKKDS
jgi:hypothetical protein